MKRAFHVSCIIALVTLLPSVCWSQFYKYKATIERSQHRDNYGRWSDPHDQTSYEAILVDEKERKIICISEKRDSDLDILEILAPVTKGSFTTYSYMCKRFYYNDKWRVDVVFDEAQRKTLFILIESKDHRVTYFL